MFLGCIMMHPTFVNIATEGTLFTVYGIPCNAQNYASTLLPIILSIWVMSYIEKFFKRILPQALKTIFRTIPKYRSNDSYLFMCIRTNWFYLR